MATVQDHLEALYAEIVRVNDRIDAVWRAVEQVSRTTSDPLQQEIDLDLPHASAGSAAAEGPAAGREATVETEVTDDSLTVSFPAASPERQAARLRFAEDVLKLNETFPGLEGSEEGLTAAECYAKGGPQWLYLGSKEGRDHIISLPAPWKQAMIEDVAQDSTRAAQEMGRDILKDVEPSSGLEVTYDYLLSSVET